MNNTLGTVQSVDEKFASIEKYKNTLQENFINFGELLSEIKRKGTFKIKGYKTFKDFIETEYNIASSFANKVISTYELFIEELDIDEYTLNLIGFDRLNMIKPFCADAELSVAETWIDEAKEKSTPELRQIIKDEKEKVKKIKPFKEVFAEQHIAKMRTFLNCSTKELNFKMAIYFHDADLNQINLEIKEKQRRLEQTSDFEGMFADFKD